MTKIYDVDGTERDAEWLAANYDGCAILPAVVTPETSEVWRLEAVIVTEGPALLKIETRNGSMPAVNQPVVMTWPDLAGPSPDLDELPPSPHNWSERGVINRTNGDGMYGAGLGSTFGPFYHAWVFSSAPSDCLTKTGMKGGTNHRGPLHGVWVLTPTGPPEPADDDVVAVLLRIERRLDALAAHLGA